MSAVHALKLARAAGVRIGIEGDALTLDADAAPPSAVLDLLAHHKAHVIALLRPAAMAGRARTGGPSSMNGRALPSSTEACHAIRPRPAPSPVASPNGSTATRCARRLVAALAAAKPNTAMTRCFPFGTEPTGHAWLHSRCWPAWHASRKAEAIAALSTFEIHETRTLP